MSELLIKQLREQRMFWVELAPAGPSDGAGPGEPAKRLRLTRPPEVDVGRLLLQGGRLQVSHDDMLRYSVGWEGFTEADILGPSVGGNTPVPFSADLWALVVADHADWAQSAAQALLASVVKHYEAKSADAKN